MSYKKQDNFFLFRLKQIRWVCRNHKKNFNFFYDFEKKKFIILIHEWEDMNFKYVIVIKFYIIVKNFPGDGTNSFTVKALNFYGKRYV